MPRPKTRPPKMGKRVLKSNISNGIMANIDRLGKMIAKGNRNEEETRRWVVDILRTAFGYRDDQIETEMKVLGKRVDIAIKSFGKVLMVIECKASNIDLRNSAIDQAANYATSLGAEWALVTNGQRWQLFHVSTNYGNEPDIVSIFDIEFYDEDGISKSDVDMLCLLAEQSLVEGGDAFAYYHFMNITSDAMIVNAILSDASLKTITNELIKQYKKEQNIVYEGLTPEDIKESIQMLLDIE